MQDINQVIKGYGPHDKHSEDKNNCTVNALSAAFEVPYDEAYEFAKQEWDRIHGKGVPTKPITESFKDTVFGKFSVQVQATIDYKQPDGSTIVRNMTLRSFLKAFPTGSYFVLVRGHALVVKDGVLIDNSKKLGRIVLRAWKIEPTQ